MTSVFIDELDNLRLKASDAQKLQHAAERAKDAAVGEKRLAEDRAGKLEQEMASLQEQLLTSGRRLAETADIAARATKAEENFHLATDRATRAEKKLETALAKNVELVEENKSLSDEVRLVKQELLAREDEFEKAQRALQAFRQKAEADKIISEL